MATASPNKMNFDLDIFTAIHITNHYFSEHTQKHFEMVLRTLELFDRADKKVTKYPKFIKMLGCFGIMIKFYDGLEVVFNDWMRIMRSCVQYCGATPKQVADWRDKISDVEWAIMKSVDFELLPSGAAPEKFRAAAGAAPENSLPLEVEQEFFAADRFCAAPLAGPRRDLAAAPAAKKGEKFSEVVMDLPGCERARCSSERALQIYHHWTTWYVMNAMEKAACTLDAGFLVKFDDEIECPALREVHSRFSALVARDNVLANIIYYHCMGKFHRVTGVIQVEDLLNVWTNKSVLSSDDAMIMFHPVIRALYPAAETAMEEVRAKADAFLREVHFSVGVAGLEELDHAEVEFDRLCARSAELLAMLGPWCVSPTDTARGIDEAVRKLAEDARDLLRERRRALEEYGLS